MAYNEQEHGIIKVLMKLAPARAMRIPVHIIPLLAVFLFSIEMATAQTEPLPPPEIQSTPLPSPEPPPILPAQQETIRRLIEKEIKESQSIGDRVEQEVDGAFGLTLGLLNLLITMLIAIPIGTGFVLWWLRQSVIDRLVKDVRKQFQQETEQVVKQQLEREVTARLQSQIAEFELEMKQLRAEFENRLNTLYQDAERDKAGIVQELEQLVASVGKDERVPLPIEQRLKELTDQLEALKAGSANLSFSASDYLNEGDAFYLRQNYEKAVAAYKQALALDPESIEARRNLAKTLRRMGRYGEALVLNEEVIQQQPQNPWGWFGKGYCLSDMQHYEAALDAYDTAIELSPDSSTFWKHRGYVLTKLRRYQEALDCFDKALHLKPHSAGTFYWRAYCYAIQQQVDLAIADLKTAIHHRPDYLEKVNFDPDFDCICTTEAFQKLISAKY